MGLRGSLSRRGQIAVDKDRVGRIEAHRLKRAQVNLSPAADAKLLAGIDEADETEDFEALLRG